MSLKKWVSFYPGVLSVLPPGCPDTTIDYALKLSTIELCRDSMVHVSDIDPFATSAGEMDYELIIDGNSSIETVIFASCDGTPMTPKTPIEISEMNMSSHAPRYFSFFSPGNLVLRPTPDKAYTISAKVSLIPSMNALGVESFIANRYYEGITSGAISRLMSMPGKTWTDIKTASIHADIFRVAKAKARIDGIVGFGPAQVHVSPRVLV